MPVVTPHRLRSEHELGFQPGHADGERYLVAGRGAQLPQFLVKSPGFLNRLPTDRAQHGPRGDPPRQVIGFVRGKQVSDVDGALPADPSRAGVQVGRPRARAHVPGVRRGQVTSGLQMFGDQRGVLLGCHGAGRFDGNRQSAMPLGAVGLQL